MITRRELLAGVALGLGGVPVARAIGPGSKLKIVQLKYAGNWDSRPNAARVYAQLVRQQTSVDVLQTAQSGVKIDDPGLFNYPFAMLLGDARFRLAAKERQRLKKWIEAGAFLFIDNTGFTQPSRSFDDSVRSELEQIFPGRSLTQIPDSHVLYRTFYVVAAVKGRAIYKNSMEGIFIDGRLAVVYSQNDLTGALDRDQIGEWRFDVVPGGPAQREAAHRLAINIIQYAMCLDYKDDQVHRDYLLRQRRWKIEPPTIKKP
ncbi:MAG: hypothetical protein ACI9OJ_003778 [Myxococcota bacterium]|jgi:hypothetical protein